MLHQLEAQLLQLAQSATIKPPQPRQHGKDMRFWLNEALILSIPADCYSTACVGGKYSDATATAATAGTACKDCAAGYFSDAGAGKQSVLLVDEATSS
jgi:hypothetical protein